MPFKLIKPFIVLVFFSLIGCGREQQTGLYYSEPMNPSSQDTSSTQESTPSKNKSDPKTNDSKNTSTAPTSSTPKKAENNWRPIPLSEFKNAPKTTLSYRTLEGATKMGGVAGGLVDVFTGGTGKEVVAWTPITGFVEKERKNILESTLEQYEEIMGKEYYFARVTKFRAPETKEQGYYTWIFSVSPKKLNTLTPTAAKMEVGSANNLPAGGVGEGSTSILTLPKKEVQSLGGLWDQKATIQIAIVRLDRSVLESKKFNTLSEVLEPVLVTSDVINFYEMEENKIYTQTYQSQKNSKEPGAILEVEFWKGDWKTNLH